MLLHRFTANTPEVTDIRCWPHHFDLTLNMSYTFEPGGKKRFLKIGYSPANPDVQEPHFFIRLAENNNSIRLYGKPKYAHYFPDTKTGIYLPLGDLVEKKTINAQTAVLSNYLKESFEIIR